MSKPDDHATTVPAVGPPLDGGVGRLLPKRCSYCRDSKHPLPETVGYDYSEWTERELERGWRWEEATNTKVYHCMHAFYGAQ